VVAGASPRGWPSHHPPGGDRIVDELQHGSGWVRWGREGLLAAPQGPQDFGLHSFLIALFHFPLLQNTPRKATSVLPFLSKPLKRQGDSKRGQVTAARGSHFLRVCNLDCWDQQKSSCLCERTLIMEQKKSLNRSLKNLPVTKRFVSKYRGIRSKISYPTVFIPCPNFWIIPWIKILFKQATTLPLCNLTIFNVVSNFVLSHKWCVSCWKKKSTYPSDSGEWKMSPTFGFFSFALPAAVSIPCPMWTWTSVRICATAVGSAQDYS
jgi:hypothetical protein